MGFIGFIGFIGFRGFRVEGFTASSTRRLRGFEGRVRLQGFGGVRCLGPFCL